MVEHTDEMIEIEYVAENKDEKTRKWIETDNEEIKIIELRKDVSDK